MHQALVVLEAKAHAAARTVYESTGSVVRLQLIPSRALAQARKLGELNGALTRVRQMLCSPFAVNADKVAQQAGAESEPPPLLGRRCRRCPAHSSPPRCTGSSPRDRLSSGSRLPHALRRSHTAAKIAPQRLPCCTAAVLPCCRAAVLPCCCATVLPCCRAAVLPCCTTALLPCCTAAAVLPVRPSGGPNVATFNGQVKARKQGEAGVLASATRLPHRTILERLVAQASRDRDHAAVAHLRASAALYMGHMALEPHVLQLQGQGERESPAAGSKSKGKRKAPGAAPASQPAGGAKSEGDLASAHGEAAVMAALDALVLRSKELCTAASEDEVVPAAGSKWRLPSVTAAPPSSVRAAPDFPEGPRRAHSP